MQKNFRRFCSGLYALLLVACSKAPSDEAAAVRPATPPPAPARAAISKEQNTSVTEIAPAPADTVGMAAPAEDQRVDVGSLERRFVAASNQPDERIAIIRELADAPPVAALISLNRLYPLERREDVKMEMLAAVGDFDHTVNRDNQLALVLKALAPEQPSRVRYVAVQVLSDLEDPRAYALLLSLKSDKDREIRAAAVQALRDMAP